MSEAADCLCRVQGDITVVDNAGFLDKLIANIFDLPELILLHLNSIRSLSPESIGPFNGA